MKKFLLIILIYFFFLLENLAFHIFPKMSITFFTLNAFSSSLLFSTFLGFFLGFLFDLNNLPILGLNMFIFSTIGFLIPYFRNYFLPTTYNILFSLIFILFLFFIANQKFFLISFLLTLLFFFLINKRYEKKI
ncbi:MAG: hypothetical protein N2323_01295 [candidate division WOR-3 bacterium]|nr:hypothetical protein [candidate division WOR-3 bacterium]MCX7836582.1 hypothetical protein [candidate division WOR-3 bacterium]MDW8114166.1 hypothetical protein [candidate division WOR-3 bacterium]